MKKVLFALFGLGMIFADVSAANAVVCARGPYRAGCAGPRGAVVTGHPHYRPYYGPHYRRPYYGPRYHHPYYGPRYHRPY
ncbi:hypothetical protein K9U39_07550 [Rhodoblastus acidophilus]|uniref:Uncharacterized protein n=1 Tax=Candidatus Rhodoblastus alkanivorans TaxID=2954117 RepID=A0ABS9Z741_9HYPH|nr:hypothetical protein [Candidatus Rhodoblastus alkanivorans]MCI4678719.1 hypothetical protein [Candidatus Rhodoblastus alkanivorans]MCI4683485.1 hypothetical protein [Candidatus Rhodoblastus alkanivorans]MDI4640799.1 hypothetical protein [Rhodoblastus acidophilus]